MGFAFARQMLWLLFSRAMNPESTNIWAIYKGLMVNKKLIVSSLFIMFFFVCMYVCVGGGKVTVMT